MLDPLNPASNAIEITAYARTIKPDWLELWDLLAYITVESGFNPRAYRYESTLVWKDPQGISHTGEASYGLMQLLLTTARQMDFTGPPEGLYDVHVNLTLGIKYLEFVIGYLAEHLGRDATETERVEAYNEGIGAVVKGRKDPAYYTKWCAARDYWKARIIKDNGG